LALWEPELDDLSVSALEDHLEPGFVCSAGAPSEDVPDTVGIALDHMQIKSLVLQKWILSEGLAAMNKPHFIQVFDDKIWNCCKPALP